MVFGKVRSCWSCNYRGKFRYSVFFVTLTAVVAILVIFLANLVFLVDLPRAMVGYRNNPEAAILAAFVLGDFYLLWFFYKRNTFFSCPKCFMPEKNDLDSKV